MQRDFPKTIVNVTPEKKIPILNQNEKKVLDYLCKDESTKIIASKLDLSPRTVESIKDKLREKFDVTHVYGLITKAIELGFVPGFYYEDPKLLEKESLEKIKTSN